VIFRKTKICQGVIYII